MPDLRSPLEQLKDLNATLLDLPLEEIYIDEIISGYSTRRGDHPTFISRAFEARRKSEGHRISYEEKKAMEDALSEGLHPILQASIAYLLYKSGDEIFAGKLKEACEEFSIDFIDAYGDGNLGLPFHSLETMLKWLEEASSKYFHELKTLIASRATKKDPLSSLLLMDEFSRRLGNGFFSGETVGDVMKLCDNLKASPTDAEAIFDCYERALHASSANKELSKHIKRLLCAFARENLELFSFHFKQINLQKTLKWASELKNVYSDEDYVAIRNSLEEANAEALRGMQSFSHQIIPDNLKPEADKYIENQTTFYKRMSPNDASDYFLATLPLLSEDSLKRQIKDRRESSVLGNLFNTKYLDSNGRVINFEDLTEQENFYLEAQEPIELFLQVHAPFYLQPFFVTFHRDNDIVERFQKVLETCPLIEPKQSREKAELFISFFESKFSESVIPIILDFEDDLRRFLKSKGHNVYRKNNPSDQLSLDSLLNYDEKNKFRSTILESIDEDYYFTLQYFLTNPYGFHLRDEISHSGNSVRISKHLNTIYICSAIIRLYRGLCLI